MPGFLAPDQKAAEAADAPEFLKLRNGHITKGNIAVDTSVENDEVRWSYPGFPCEGIFEQADNIALVGRVCCHRLGAATGCDDCICDLRDLVERPPGNDDMVAFLGE